jgi:hypothetical protein
VSAIADGAPAGATTLHTWLGRYEARRPIGRGAMGVAIGEAWR